MRGINFISVFVLILILGLVQFVDGISFTEDEKLIASDAKEGDELGWSVKISGDIALVGAPLKDNECPPDPLSSMLEDCNTGSIYVFEKNGNTWKEQAILTATNVSAGFGWSVGISGDTIIGGAQFEDIAGTLSGSAYVFTRSGSTWTEEAKLTASDVAAGDEFGRTVSISGDTVIVGAFRDDDAGTDSGSAYVFTRSGNIWTEEAKLTASDAAAGDEFGRTVSISGDTVIVGASSNADAGTDSGSAYVFTRSGNIWTEEAKLTASDADAGDYFGYSVSISGDTAIIGANRYDNVGFHSGAAYVFTRSGNTWTEGAKLTASDAGQNHFFGYSVSISGDKAIVGAPSFEVPWEFVANRPNSGAYVFVRDAVGNWMQSTKLIPSNYNEGDFFGTSVSISGNKAIVGRSSGVGGETFGVGIRSAYVFEDLPVSADAVGVIDFLDECPNDPDKTKPGLTGCGNPEIPTIALWLILAIAAGVGIGFVIIRRKLFR